MSTDERYFIFSGHAVGVAAQFDKLDHLENLNHRVPTLGASVLPATGGISHGSAANYAYAVEVPRKRTLIQVDRVATKADGRTYPDRWETEIEADIDGVRVLEKLEIGSVRLHMLAVRDSKSEDCNATKVTTRGSHIEGLRMGGMTAKVFLASDALENCGSKDQLTDWHSKQPSGWRNAHPLRNVNDRVKFSLVRDIQLSGEQDPEHKVYLLEDGYTIKWDGFGRIILGETSIKGCDRRVTMVRLAMGSDGGGSGTVGDGGSNGVIGP